MQEFVEMKKLVSTLPDGALSQFFPLRQRGLQEFQDGTLHLQQVLQKIIVMWLAKGGTHLESLESLRLWVKGPDASKAEAGKLSGPCADVAVFLGVEMRTMLGFLGDLVQVLHIHPTIESERAARKDGQELQPPFGDVISFLSFADAAADTARCGGQDDITTAVKALLTLVMSTSVKSIKNLPPITL